MRVWEWHGIDMYCPEFIKIEAQQLRIMYAPQNPSLKEFDIVLPLYGLVALLA